jgi:hypothetical protein
VKGFCRNSVSESSAPRCTTALAVLPDMNSTFDAGRSGQSLDQLPAAHLRHDHVGEEEMNRSRCRSEVSSA